MKRLVLFMAFLILSPALGHAQTLDMSGYQEPNGAITTKFHGDTVDPYFATDALLIAKTSGMNIDVPAKAWIAWALSIQNSDGLFNRYKRDTNGAWHSYAGADADDSMLALWLELLYRMSPANGLPKEWRQSVHKAETQLQALYDPEQGIYLISKTLPTGLLMDNVEIYAAFKNIAHDQNRMGMPIKALMSAYKAWCLKQNILNIFKQTNSNVFRVTTQTRTENAFYPDQAAQIFPLLYHMQDKSESVLTYRAWVRANGKEWFKQINDDYPWGLIAITALNMGDASSAACWQASAEAMRYGAHWNVLEESALQQVKWRLDVRQDNSVPCTGKDFL